MREVYCCTFCGAYCMKDKEIDKQTEAERFNLCDECYILSVKRLQKEDKEKDNK